MSYPTVTIHLDSGSRCDTRVALASLIAAEHGSRLVGIAPTGVPDVILTLNAAVPDSVNLVALSSAYLRSRAEAVARSFEEKARAMPSIACESRSVDEEAADAMCAWGRCSDLVVLGQTDRSETVDGVAFDLRQQVLLHAGAPLLVVPYAGTFGTVGKRVLVAWKDTREAARAVRDALLSLATDLAADLVVTGGYGHSRLREWALGGMTRHWLEHMTVPVLMSH